MDASELRSLQAPLKERYREYPATATTPLSAKGVAGEKPVTFEVEQWSGTTRSGWHRAIGGDGTDACSGNMLLEAVLGCAGVTMRSVATAMSLDIRAMSGQASATFDVRGTLGMDRSVPVGISDLLLEFELDSDATDEQLANLARLTERYCVVGQSLAAPPVIRVARSESAQDTLSN